MKAGGWTGVVLAGGRSSRMGKDKALVTWAPAGRSLLDHALDRLAPLVDDVLVVGHPEAHAQVGPIVIPDTTPHLGPLGGAVTAMRYATHDRLLVLAVDMPCVPPQFLAFLQGRLGHFTDAVIPRHGGRVEPLCGAYHRRCSKLFEDALAGGVRRMRDALELVRTHYVDVEPGKANWPDDLFHNVNRPGDLP